MHKVRERIVYLQRAKKSCVKAIETCKEFVRPQLVDYLEQLLLCIGILKLQLKNNFSNVEMAKEIGLYETKITEFESFANLDFNEQDKLKILKYIIEHL